MCSQQVCASPRLPVLPNVLVRTESPFPWRGTAMGAQTLFVDDVLLSVLHWTCVVLLYTVRMYFCRNVPATIFCLMRVKLKVELQIL